MEPFEDTLAGMIYKKRANG